MDSALLNNEPRLVTYFSVYTPAVHYRHFYEGHGFDFMLATGVVPVLLNGQLAMARRFTPNIVDGLEFATNETFEREGEGALAFEVPLMMNWSFHWAACLMSPRELEKAFDDKGVTPTTIDACFSNFLQGMVSGFL